MSDAASQPDRPFLIAAPPTLAAMALAVTAVASGSDGGRVATLAGIYALLVVGYQFVFGRLGALSLGQKRFLRLGRVCHGAAGDDVRIGPF